MTDDLVRENPDGTVDMRLGVANVNDRVLAELRAFAASTGLTLSEALAFLIGLGTQSAIDLGVIRRRSLEPMSRRELLDGIRHMLEAEDADADEDEASDRVKLSRELRDQIDQARGGTPREAWVREACEMRIYSIDWANRAAAEDDAS